MRAMREFSIKYVTPPTTLYDCTSRRNLIRQLERSKQDEGSKGEPRMLPGGNEDQVRGDLPKGQPVIDVAKAQPMTDLKRCSLQQVREKGSLQASVQIRTGRDHRGREDSRRWSISRSRQRHKR